MTILGIADATVASLVRPVTDPAHDRDAVAERFARATWTGIAEPGDRIAGLVVGALGAEAALAALIDDREGKLLTHTLSEHDVELDPDELSQGIARWVPRISKTDALRALRQAARFGARLVVPGDPEWPSGFADLGEFAPLGLWVRGDRGRLNALERGVAIVGARAASGYGEHVAIELSAGLADRGYAIVSGAAYGIDGAAHRGALDVHRDAAERDGASSPGSDCPAAGPPVGVVAAGLDIAYPARHERLHREVAEVGVLVSETPVGRRPTEWRFPARNRIIAGLSDAVVVVESRTTGGSLITVDEAQKRDTTVLAVPGHPTSPAAAGTNALLFDGAAVVRDVDDVLGMLALPLRTPPPAQPGPGGRAPDEAVSETEAVILDRLDAGPQALGELVSATGLGIDDVAAALTGLEVRGRVVSAGGWFEPVAGPTRDRRR